MLTAGTPVGAGIGPYTRSKIAAELVACGSQQAGSPVVITYPAVVQGPHDPHLGDSVRFVRDLLRGRLPGPAAGEAEFRRRARRGAAAWPTARSACSRCGCRSARNRRHCPSASRPASWWMTPRQELAIERHEPRETLADTVRWLAARGLVTARQAGALTG